MKRTHVNPVDLLLAAMALAFVFLATPAAAAAPCVALGEYYTFAQQCAAANAADSGWLALLLLQAALVGGTLGVVALRRHVLRRDWTTGAAPRR
jgi:hypothetical protein